MQCVLATSMYVYNDPIPTLHLIHVIKTKQLEIKT